MWHMCGVWLACVCGGGGDNVKNEMGSERDDGKRAAWECFGIESVVKMLLRLDPAAAENVLGVGQERKQSF